MMVENNNSSYSKVFIFQRKLLMIPIYPGRPVSMVRISKDICNNNNDINIVLCNCLSKLSFIKYFVDALK